MYVRMCVRDMEKDMSCSLGLSTALHPTHLLGSLLVQRGETWRT